MNLSSNAFVVVKWYFGVLARLLRVDFWTSAVVIAYAVAARITRILAFLLPLKVVLLAGSEGVPRYFEFIVPLDRKLEGVAALSVAAIVFYALTLLLESRIRRLSQKGGQSLLTASGVMAVVGNQNAQAQAFYSDLTRLAADMLFAIVGLVLIAVMNPLLGGYLVIAIAGCYGVTALVVHGSTPVRRSRFAHYILSDTANYLSILSSIVFLTSFLVILYPFVIGADVNILIAIICIVGLRRVLSAITDGVKLTLGLHRQTLLINALVFPHHQFQLTENLDQRTLRDLFERGAREKKFKEDLRDTIEPDESVSLDWIDPPSKTMAMFSVVATKQDGRRRYFQQRVYPQRLAHLAANEDLLFRHIPREVVWAPPLVKRFSYGAYSIIVNDAGTGAPPALADWSKIEASFLTDLWSVELPEDLLATYSASHKFLYQRLTRDFVRRLDIAINNDSEAVQFELFLENLPDLHSAIAALPHRLVNSAFSQTQIMARDEGGYFACDWSDWSIEPIAGNANRAPQLGTRLFRSVLAALRERNPASVSDNVSERNMVLARRSAWLERDILRGAYSSGLHVVQRINADMAMLRSGQPADIDQPVDGIDADAI